MIFVTFVIGFLLDFAYARWTIAAADRRAVAAGFWAAAIGAASIAMTKIMIDTSGDLRIAAFYVCGLGLGSFVAVVTKKGGRE